MAILAVQRSGSLGLAQKTLAAAAGGGDSFPNDGATNFEIAVGVTATTVTFVSVPCTHGRTKDLVLGPITSQTHVIGPFDPTLFNDVNGRVNVTYSQVANVTVAATRTNN